MFYIFNFINKKFCNMNKIIKKSLQTTTKYNILLVKKIY